MIRIKLAALSATLAIVSVAAAQSEDPMEILAKADAATKAVKKVSYRASFSASGNLAQRMPSVTGKVLAWPPPKRGLIARMLDRGQDNTRLSVQAAVTRPGATEAVQIRAATDGQKTILIDDSNKTFRRAKGWGSRTLMHDANRLYMIEYLHATPFSDELNGKSVEYEGVEKVGDVDCDVVYVVYSTDQDQQSRWYFGRKDHLPRRVDRIGVRGRGDTMLIVTDLETEPTAGADAFELEAPAEFRETRPGRRGNPGVFNPPRAGLLAAGSKAPDWELKTPDGKVVSLKSLHGQVVVLEFWATWCVTCNVAMPGVQKVHDEFKGQPVQVFGISTFERGGDPAAFMKKKGFSYGLLLDGNKVAEKYNINGIPTFYVIGADGKVLYAKSAIGLEKEIARIIRENLPPSDL